MGGKCQVISIMCYVLGTHQISSVDDSITNTPVHRSAKCYVTVAILNVMIKSELKNLAHGRMINLSK